MKKETKNYAQILFWVIEINLLLWFAVLGSVIGIKEAVPAEMLQYHKYFCYAGVGLAVIIQHWSYYKIYKPAKEIQKQNHKANRTSFVGPVA